MNIENKKVVSFHYTLKNDQGEEIESSRERENPMIYLHGAGNIIPGLEKAMEGKAAGDQFEVTVEPAEAYGERNEAAIQRVPVKHFGEGRRLKNPPLLPPIAPPVRNWLAHLRNIPMMCGQWSRRRSDPSGRRPSKATAPW